MVTGQKHIRKMSWTIIQVAVGGALGAVGRYLTGVGLARAFGSSFPYGTLTVNVSGSFIVGVLFVLFGGLSGETGRYTALVMTGFLGGYTTFSAYSLDCWLLFQQGTEPGSSAVCVRLCRTFHCCLHRWNRGGSSQSGVKFLSWRIFTQQLGR